MNLLTEFLSGPLMRSMLPGFIYVTSLSTLAVAVLKPISGPLLGLAYTWRDVVYVALLLWVGLPLGCAAVALAFAIV